MIIRATEAIVSAVTTDQTPLTATSVVPNLGSARNSVFARGSTMKLMTRLTTSTMTIGVIARPKGGS